MILCTGTEGFIGKHLMNALYPRPMLCIDPRQPPQCALIIDEALKTFGPDIEAVFHLGAISDTTCEDTFALWGANVNLSGKLANFCAKKSIPFIYCSSASVYGNEAPHIKPLNSYAWSKAEFDALTDGLIMPEHWYGLRLFNCYGPGEEHKGKQASMPFQLIQRAHRREVMEIFKPDAQRDFVHVDDVVSVMLHMWRARPPSGIYDVGTGNARSFEKVAQIVQSNFVGRDPMCAYKEIPFPESLEGKYQFHTQADLTKLRAAGYDKPFLSLEQGMTKMLEAARARIL